MSKILIVEDDRNTLSGLVEILGEEGYEVEGVETSKKALKSLQKETFDILLTDLRMPDMNGMQLFERSLTIAPEMKTIVMTAYSSVKDAVEAMKKGVYEYLTKPLDLDELFVIIEKALGEQELQRENVELRKQVKSTYSFQNIIGKSAPMQQIFSTIVKVAKTQSTVLIRGESGTGKELVARAIHYNSPRSNKPLVEISCASFPESLLESELFGYEKGAFTGADSRKKGRFELANEGTIFLDEIGDITESVQTKLLRVLQERQITRLGGTETIDVDVRVITATNRDLEQAMDERKFRDDLFYRLNVIPITLPPLRERIEDIPLLIEHFMKKYSVQNKIPTPSLSAEALEVCMNYSWPGNVRELENAIESAIVLGEGSTILPEHIPLGGRRKALGANKVDFLKNSGETFKDKIEAVERLILQDAIEQASGNKSEAAKVLDISLRTMRYKIKKYGL
ncbi:sigma-54-dependent Fis family transcriptional regulator [candidate division KSB1 bacterium]|nr:sigma-54-dependent Fis family transcriptional regulator [candidate division KSB1 bacterium]NIR73444.1 sigma-54-dependent Fis family transcriptional regulator [candidate division KSB1 bacterium]NIS27059.1 sigma-54-dependent Fis family transcriptional regulator [candidate division KSB1 bacterium]NIT73903.1 sigma-54-dependent Fis family transcriptional regulator [candidate division KSB1 bacterium]NIU27804.1 sigma-54-dependent Fis family transcriptional regulator [candidate division KSB1 bacteri